jgi:ribonucleotide reductase beta subunit family protein with ferritin-like domain/putative sterol carrier protein
VSTAYAEQISYEDLYRRWEKGNWSAFEIDFSVDREQWAGLSQLERDAALWNYSLFFHGEDIVATDLAPFVDAAPLEEQRYFLATQQVDEARHAIFFNRFIHEVVGLGDGTVASGLTATRPQLTWGFVKTFEKLDEVTGRLRKDRSTLALARAVFMYHFLVEATLAQPGQHFIQAYLEQRDILPGFRAGMRNVSLDEQRHIAFGVRLLHDLAKADPRVREAVAELMREVMPYSVTLFIPPGWDRRYTEIFGFTLEEIFEEGARSMEQKLRAAGLPLEEFESPIPLPADLTPRERGERGIKMAAAGIMGDGSTPVAPSSPEILELLFDTMRRGVDHRRAPGRPVTLQWDFTDADPWHLRVDNGSSAAAPGLQAQADVTFKVSYRDWVDVIGGRTDPMRLMARGRLRPKGSLRALLMMRRLFPQ